MDGEEQPFGHTHRRQKRSHAQMEDEGSASPSWRAEPFTNPEDVPPRQTNTTRHTNYISARPDPGQGASRSSFPQFYPRFNPNLPQPPTRPSAFESALRAARPPMRIAPAMQRETHGLPASSSTRYVGDGLDFRWPAGSSREQNIGPVDLTGDEDDDRMPVIGQDTERFDDDVVTRQNTQSFNDDNVIDLTADDPGYGHPYGIDNVNFSGLPRSNESRYPYDDIVAERNRIHAQAHANNAMTRLPRGMDIIIDLDNGQEEWRMATPAPEPTVPEPTAQEPAVPEPSSPDIEFISSRTIDPRRLPRPASGGNNSDGDEVEFLRENALPEAEIRRRRNRELDNVLNLFGTLNGRFTHLRAQVDRFNAQINRTAGRFHEPTPPARNTTRGHAHIRLGTFVAPVMDFDTIGFELGPRPREQPAPPPTYDAPPEAPEGFTRSPDEEGELVCPNCDEELCVGSDEIKRQVWIVKACGHVYCGECTTNRAAKRTVKGKEKPTNTNPFKTCVVDGCDKNVSHKKSMIQVFL